ncbi:hypothetical protein AVEN_169365-1 [Araneus ventricosus]|uniref:Uncharacterized protein n=1 Tax=Araneus ventricosus TaxID=182803 RepID=A0A4Y2VPI9_ARAVE|nr:hypothetical protein AVEN_169365-1 [Araneus ventricosus]
MLLNMTLTSLKQYPLVSIVNEIVSLDKIMGLEVDNKNIDKLVEEPRADHRRAYVAALCFTARSYGREFGRGGGSSKVRIFYRNKRNTESMGKCCILY